MTKGAGRGKAATGLVVLGEARGRAPGRVRLVGAGPGDPELLTLKALKALQAAQVVVHDGLVPDEILALAPADARRISVAKRKSRHSYPTVRPLSSATACRSAMSTLSFAVIDGDCAS